MKKALLLAVIIAFSLVLIPQFGQATQLPVKNFYSNASASGYEKFYNDSGTVYFWIYNGTNATTNFDKNGNVYQILRFNGTDYSQIVQQKIPSSVAKNLTTAGRTMEALAVSNNYIFVEYYTGNAAQGQFKHVVDVFNKTSGVLINEGDVGYGTGAQCNQFATGADYTNSPFVVLPDNTVLTTVAYHGNFIVGRFNASKTINDCPSATAIGSDTVGETTTNALNGTDFWVLSKGVATTYKVFRSSDKGATFTTVGTFGSGGNTNGVRYGGLYRIYDNAVNQYFLSDASGTGAVFNITQLWYSSNGGVTWKNPFNLTLPSSTSSETFSNYPSSEAASNTGAVAAYGLFRLENGTMVIAEKRNNDLVTYECNATLSCGSATTYVQNIGGFSTDANGNMLVKTLAGNMYLVTYPEQSIDEVAPAWSNITETPASPVTRNTTSNFNATFTINATDNVAISTVVFDFNEVNYTATQIGSSTGYTVTIEASCGMNNYDFHLNDTSGNTNSTGDFPYTVSCGETIPTINLASPVNFYNATTVPLVFTAFNNESISACYYSIDDGSPVDIPSCFNQTLANISTTFTTTEGPHTLALFVNDTFSILNFTESNFTVDLTPPGVGVALPTGTSANTAFSVVYIAADALSGLNTSSCYYFTDYNTTPVPLPLCSSGSGTASAGTHTLTVVAYDLAGNIGSGTTTFTIGLPPQVQGTSAGIILLFPIFLGIMMLLLGVKFMLDALNGRGSFITAVSFFIIGVVIILIVFGLAQQATSIRVV